MTHCNREEEVLEKIPIVPSHLDGLLRLILLSTSERRMKKKGLNFPRETAQIMKEIARTHHDLTINAQDSLRTLQRGDRFASYRFLKYLQLHSNIRQTRDLMMII